MRDSLKLYVQHPLTHSITSIAEQTAERPLIILSEYVKHEGAALSDDQNNVDLHTNEVTPTPNP